MSDQLCLRSTLKGHGEWISQIATTPSVHDMILPGWYAYDMHKPGLDDTHVVILVSSLYSLDWITGLTFDPKIPTKM